MAKYENLFFINLLRVKHRNLKRKTSLIQMRTNGEVSFGASNSIVAAFQSLAICRSLVSCLVHTLTCTVYFLECDYVVVKGGGASSFIGIRKIINYTWPMNSINETTFIINAQASTDGVIGTLILTRDPEKNKIKLSLDRNRRLFNKN